ncbi:unnamed protein product [Hydatigera taeniaeformis]|uniref:SHSP domain-containing protein n=1 Tax=Hydatigena taeniaeformis TaxID=6205 RepID=A0A0R3X3Y5_HYDTA|nr:unnamed protein product [Hydatigera taeniaeformis]
MDPVSEPYSRYIRDRYLLAGDSGFHSADTMDERNDRWPPSRSTSPTSPSTDSYFREHYGVFFMDEDIEENSAKQTKEETKEESSDSTSQSSDEKGSIATSIHFPAVFVEGFCEGRVEFNIPGVMKDQFSPPDDINVHFKFPSDDSGQLHNSDIECLTKAGEVMTQWRKRKKTHSHFMATQHSRSQLYRSYFEGDDS